MADLSGWTPMDELVLVGQIISECLTTEVLQKYYPSWKKENVGKVSAYREGKNMLFAELLEHSGQILMRELKRELTPDEVILVYNRVQQFLIARGF